MSISENKRRNIECEWVIVFIYLEIVRVFIVVLSGKVLFYIYFRFLNVIEWVCFVFFLLVIGIGRGNGFNFLE